MLCVQEMEIGERSLLKMILRLHLEHVAYPHIAQVIALLERYFTIIDAVRCAMLIREEGNLDPIGEETVSLKPVFTDPVFI
jgi:hypothetical protein